jgi:hypothetical protein
VVIVGVGLALVGAGVFVATGPLAGTSAELDVVGGGGSAAGSAVASSYSRGLEVAEVGAAELLESLDVKGRAPKTGYDRPGQFGTAWLDVDRNGCDTRNDTLSRDLTKVEVSGPCKVLRGMLDDPYTGSTISFVRGNETSLAVQIDHVVALMDAWQTGAQQLTLEERIRLANDPLNLQAVDGSANSQKQASNAASWLPPNKAFRCEYAARQVSVKAAYELWVTEPEKAALSRILEGCGDQDAYESVLGEASAPDQTEPTAWPSPADKGAFETCAAARSAGAAPVRAGSPGYAEHLDGDGDGIGCE